MAQEAAYPLPTAAAAVLCMTDGKLPAPGTTGAPRLGILLDVLDELGQTGVLRGLFALAAGRGVADACDLGFEVAEGRFAAAGPGAEGGDHGRDGAGGKIAEGGEGVHLDDLTVGVEGRVEEAGVDCGDDEVFQGAGGGEAEGGLEGCVGQVRAVAGQGQEGELAELEGLGIVELGQAPRCRGGLVGGVGAVGEELEEAEVRFEVGGLGEGLDLRGLEELCEEEGVWV